MPARRGGWIRVLAAVGSASVLTATLVIISPLAASPVGAEVYTCGTQGNYFAGYAQTPGTGPAYEGVSAKIVTEYGAVCDTVTGHPNFTAEWSMIASGDGSSWAQSGYIRWYGSVDHFFAQQFDGGTDLQTVYGVGTSENEDHTYKTTWSSSTGDLSSIVDATTFLTSSWNPFNIWPSFSAQYSGETAYLASDIAGNAADQTAYTAIKGQLQSDNSLADVNCTTLTHHNDGAAKRADGEAWYDKVVSPCPDFVNYTDTAGN